MDSKQEIIRKEKKPLFSKHLKFRLKRYTGIYIMLIPGIIWALAFCYAPMYGLLIAFKDYSPSAGVWGSPWVGLKHFKALFESDFWKIMRNTLLISVSNLVLGFPLPIMFAILITGIKNTVFRKVTQTLSYVPHFVSWVVVSSICYVFFAPQVGFLNVALRNLGIIETSVGFLENGPMFVVMMILTNIWKGTGWSAIIYFAAIAGVDAELYEAATIDGARQFQRTIYITIPSIMPTVVIMLILQISSILNAGFEQQMVMANDLVWEWADVLDTYAYRYGLKLLRYSYGSAVGFFKSTVACILLFFSNWLSRKVTGYGLYS
ncbi:MAG: sugar ABC transporter permease [Clostridiales bacterium]|nr:sugar ABC transporter permease [Clostridiales bacterium]